MDVNRISGTSVAAMNCDPSLGRQSGERCPHCHQWHLVEGYCRALAASFRPAPVALSAPIPAIEDGTDEARKEKRRVAARESMRKKRLRSKKAKS